MSFPVTITLSSLLALWLLVLSFRTSRYRSTAKASLGDGDNKQLLRRMRAQGNLIEYAPVTLILFGFAEYLQTNIYFLGAAAILFFTARLAHGYALSFSSNNPPARYYGIVATYLVLLVMPINNLIMAFI